MHPHALKNDFAVCHRWPVQQCVSRLPVASCPPQCSGISSEFLHPPNPPPATRAAAPTSRLRSQPLHLPVLPKHSRQGVFTGRASSRWRKSEGFLSGRANRYDPRGDACVAGVHHARSESNRLDVGHTLVRSGRVVRGSRCRTSEASNRRLPPDYRMADYTSDRLAGVTDLVAFSAMLTAEGRIDTSRIPEGQLARMRIWKRDLGLRLLLCVGGWERSQGFAKVSSNAELRKSFIEQGVRLCLEERLDGLDLDWEHPEGATEQAAYGELLAEMRQAFDEKGLQLSIAVAPWQHLPKQAWQAPHKIHLMAYDNPVDMRRSTMRVWPSTRCGRRG